MTWRGTRALVTGGAAFIGSHLAERLVELGAWSPRVSLEQGLQKTVRWVQENLARYRRSVYVV